MNNLLFDEVEGYEKGMWKKVAVHDENNIKGFFGDYRFLSNFYSVEINYNGKIYQSSEHAYQASKVVPEERYKFDNVTARIAKNLWKKCMLLHTPFEWEIKKYGIMYDILWIKFNIPEFKEMLLSTGGRYLEELNWWGDRNYGVDYKTGKGENNLGKILMDIRKRL